MRSRCRVDLCNEPLLTRPCGSRLRGALGNEPRLTWKVGTGSGTSLVMNRASLGKAGAGAGFTLVMKRASLGQAAAGASGATTSSSNLAFVGLGAGSGIGSSSNRAVAFFGSGLGAGFGAGAEGLRETPTVPAVSIPPTPLRRAPSGVVLTSAINPAASATHGVRSGVFGGGSGATTTPLQPCKPHNRENSDDEITCSPSVGSL